ncbi:hypothetical protein [Demequina aurantiaca]|uniref:hypothetical protein n=1 Tax=Demequina aurantiaca TaxID=676200 RepID=UPI003D32B6D9
MSTNNSRKTTKGQSILVRVFALICGAAAATALALIAHSAGYNSIAKGALQGASVTLLVIAVLWFGGSRFGLAARIASGESDERERLNTTRAVADAGYGMGVACISGLIAGMYGMPAPLVAGSILWVGLLTGATSLVIRTRRT